MPKRRKKSLKQKRKDCRKLGQVYDVVTKNCRPSRRSGRKRGSRRRRRSRRKSIKQLRADCRKRGKVYDVKTRKCRDQKRSGRKRGSRNRRRRLIRDQKTCSCQSWVRKTRRSIF